MDSLYSSSIFLLLPSPLEELRVVTAVNTRSCCGQACQGTCTPTQDSHSQSDRFKKHTHAELRRSSQQKLKILSGSLRVRCNLTTGDIDSTACRLFIEASTIITTRSPACLFACPDASLSRQRHCVEKEKQQ